MPPWTASCNAEVALLGLPASRNAFCSVSSFDDNMQMSICALGRFEVLHIFEEVDGAPADVDVLWSQTQPAPSLKSAWA